MATNNFITMGQRLNIEFLAENDEVVANCYYHWSGYTGSAIYHTLNILNYLLVHRKKRVLRPEDIPQGNNNTAMLIAMLNKELNNLELAVVLLELDGATFPKAEVDEIEVQNIEINKDLIIIKGDRNEGLISITPKGIEETHIYEESRVTISLTSNTIDFGCVNFEGNRDEYFKDYEKYPSKETIAWSGDIHAIPFGKFDNFAKAYFEAYNNGTYALQLDEDYFVCGVE